MSEYFMDAAPRPLQIGLTGLEEIEQNIRIIIGTREFSVRLDCPFADSGSYIDSPLPHQTALRVTELIEAIERNEPRVTVLSLKFADNPAAAQNGIAYPTLRYAIKEGVTL